MRLFTIGFTKKTAEQFFARLDRPDLLRVVDVRLKHGSQLAGFAKGDDLRFFLQKIIGKNYRHQPELAPTADMLRTYRNGKDGWAAYERDFLRLLKVRQVEAKLPAMLLDGDCLLCSEATPEHCHRRLVAEYFAAHWPDVEVTHLV